MCKERDKRKRTTDGSPEGDSASEKKGRESTVSEENVVEKEASYTAKRRFSDGAAFASTVDSRQFASEIMQSAKKLVLHDEEVNREYKRLQRPADAVAKTARSLQLSDTLHNQSLADDRKVREYVAALHRYLNTRKEVLQEPTVEVSPVEAPPSSPPPSSGKLRKRRRQEQKQQRRRLQWDQY